MPCCLLHPNDLQPYFHHPSAGGDRCLLLSSRAIRRAAVAMRLGVTMVVARAVVQGRLASARSSCTLCVLTLEAVQSAEVVLQQLLQPGLNLNLLVLGQAAVVVERPVLLQAVQAATVVILRRDAAKHA